jgi:hypothetical protein
MLTTIQNKNPFDIYTHEITEIVSVGDFTIARNQMGGCLAVHRMTQECYVLNKNKKEFIKNVFNNPANGDLMVVIMKEKQNTYRMKCKAYSLKLLEDQRDTTQGAPNSKLFYKSCTKLFDRFVLQPPDFIEFDDTNHKILTKHSEEKAYRIWCLDTYKMCYVIKHDYIDDLKICNGIIVIMFQAIKNASIPMTVINMHNGKVLMSLAYSGNV